MQNIREANAARNLTTISLLRRFGLAENQGRGVDVMQDTMAEEMLDPRDVLVAECGVEAVADLAQLALLLVEEGGESDCDVAVGSTPFLAAGDMSRPI